MLKPVTFVMFLASAASPGCVSSGGSGDVGESAEEGSAAGNNIEQEERVASASQSIVYPKQVPTCTEAGQQQASCDVFCPAGYMATGGGCKTSTIFWEISESYPTSGAEGWHCQANEDFGSKAYGHSVTGYAVCILF